MKIQKKDLPLSRREFLQTAGLLTGVAILASCKSNITLPEPVDEPEESLQLLEDAISETQIPDTPAVQSLENAFIPIESPNSPLGEARGINPGRVVWIHDPNVARWDGVNGYWWQPENLDSDLVKEMLSKSLRTLTNQGDETSAWGALVRHFNQQHGRDGGYQPGEKIAIKLNQNACTSYNYSGNHNFSSPQLALAIVESLISAGVDPVNIALYDSTRVIPDLTTRYFNEAGITQVSFQDFGEVPGGAGFCQPIRRDARNKIHWSVEVNGNPTYLPTVVTEASYIINLSSLKGHSLAGVTLCAKNHFGTISADLQGKPSFNAPQGANVHGYIAAHDFNVGPGWAWPQCAMGTYNALVDLMAHPHVGEKTLLFLVEGFYAVHEQNTEMTALNRWKSVPFDGHWPSSLFASQDGVAIDSVALDFLRNEPTIIAGGVLPENSTCDNYLHEAAQVGDPPSATQYQPTGEPGTLLKESLGVHEHWNNASEKKYSRNLGSGNGIELVSFG